MAVAAKYGLKYCLLFVDLGVPGILQSIAQLRESLVSTSSKQIGSTREQLVIGISSLVNK